MHNKCVSVDYKLHRFFRPLTLSGIKQVFYFLNENVLSFFLAIITTMTLLLADNDQYVASVLQHTESFISCQCTWCFKSFCAVMQVLQSLWGLQGVKQHTL